MLSFDECETARLLDGGDTKTSDIAFQAGFGSIRQFNSVFSAACGIPPSEYRARPAQRPGKQIQGSRKKTGTNH
ncbi:helix-turn-helix domain-containing protein [Phaeobacter piscinae]|uniref:helix-turn-helix domain-containing protein n=1 Tax=Phaeobacter piscinae TaxID=1580596 RepID=UPI000BBE6C6A|nr:helix-turn-helix domain-containing protein [Phaeobacter piscinae]ATG41855.1 Adenosine deaminase [Phaeobacter piscinae]